MNGKMDDSTVVALTHGQVELNTQEIGKEARRMVQVDLFGLMAQNMKVNDDYYVCVCVCVYIYSELL